LIGNLPPIFNIENSRDITIAFRAIALIYYAAVGYHLILQKRISIGLFGVAYVAFWLMYSARILFETTQRPETLGRPDYEYYLYPFFITLIPSLFCYCRYSIGEALIAGKLLLALLIVDALVINVTYFTVSVVTITESERIQFALETINPITIGHLGLTLVLLSVALFSRVASSYRISLGVGAALGFWLLIASASRGAMLSFVGVAGVYWAIKIWRSLRRKFVFETASLAVLATILMVLPVWLAGYVAGLRRWEPGGGHYCVAR
jgi:hypothetical protein